MKRWLRWAASWYPASWRRRYGAEFDALIDDAAPRWSDVWDVLRGAIAMQMKVWDGYFKAAIVTGAVGAVVAFGVSLAVADVWVSSAVVRVNVPQQDMAPTLQKVFARDALSDIMSSPSLDLYRKGRARTPMEDVVLEMRRNIHVRNLGDPASDGSTLRISYRYPDRYKAQAVVKWLVASISEAQRGKADLLEPPVAPETPVSPNRLVITIMGLFGGCCVGMLGSMVWRRKRTSSPA